MGRRKEYWYYIQFKADNQTKIDLEVLANALGGKDQSDTIRRWIAIGGKLAREKGFGTTGRDRLLMPSTSLLIPDE